MITKFMPAYFGQDYGLDRLNALLREVASEVIQRELAYDECRSEFPLKGGQCQADRDGDGAGDACDPF